MHGADRARAGRGNGVLHLHGVEDDDDIAVADSVPLAHVHGRDASSEGRADLAGRAFAGADGSGGAGGRHEAQADVPGRSRDGDRAVVLDGRGGRG